MNQPIIAIAEDALPLPVTLVVAAIRSYFLRNSVVIGTLSITDIVEECKLLPVVQKYIHHGAISAAIQGTNLSESLLAQRNYMVRVLISNQLKAYIDFGSGATRHGKINKES